ncbi:MAG: FecR domain-containing protein, partial [bacterium]|nr:FecR domain-containing protein [bacterium]
MTGQTNPDPVQQAAVDWFVRLQGDASLEDWTAFQSWLEAGPHHAWAYETVEALWVELDDPSLIESSTPILTDNVVAMPTRAKRPSGRWVWAGLAAAAAAAVVFAVAPRLVVPSFTDYATRPGETRELALADGSHLTLGSATALRVRLNRNQRDVTLVDGEAIFDIAHDVNRPFVIGVADRQVRVLGTEFNILSH